MRLQNGREQGEWDKMSKGAGSIDPPNRASAEGTIYQYTDFETSGM